MTFYTVQPGDTLGAIAQAFSTTVSALQDVNAIPDPNVIFAGQILCIPAWGTYTVQAGDTLGEIAQTFGITVEALTDVNAIPDPDAIFVGQILFVPFLGTYTVQAGDNLSEIALTFGTTADALLAANCHVIRLPGVIQVGQTFAVPQRDEGEEIGEVSERQREAMPAPLKALRLTFTYEGDEVRLVSRHLVEMIVPPTDKLSGYEREQGFWVEVRGDQDETLYRRVMQDPLRQDVEVFSPDPRESVYRRMVEKSSGSFSVVVPYLDDADHVALMSSGAVPVRAPSGPATEVARFSLRSSPEGGQT